MAVFFMDFIDFIAFFMAVFFTDFIDFFPLPATSSRAAASGGSAAGIKAGISSLIVETGVRRGS